MSPRVGLVVVSHSAALAAGVVEVAAQMAPDVVVVAAGGTSDGGIGTDFDAVTAAIERADSGAGVVVLYDLGSARMVAEMAIETAENAHLADAPLVEGTVSAAVAAQGGADAAAVVDAAKEAVRTEAELITADAAREPGSAEGDRVVAGAIDIAGGASVAAATQGRLEAVVVTLTNEIGLHARPAAVVARAMTGFDALVTVRFGDAKADGRSVLGLMALGARGGDEVRVEATGPQATEALRTFQDLAASNFGD
ncbi:dihydroxyacetone kinase phosphoryl donor subunit DhaM [Actinophytocola sp.]|uniref:dihydroxyacetone kinase phosphoryl donor subunit DhaM n=1 Tax=Actinophytocola sp. TaxID=1872138 RepID=UPI002ED2CDBB